MALSSAVIDREAVHDSFRQWQAEQAELDAQLFESVAALEAYQSHLDSWQRDLAAEREELQRQRAALDRDQVGAQSSQQHAQQLQCELHDAQQKINGLTSSLLTRTEELREFDRERGGHNTELRSARIREQELMTAVETQQQTHEQERQLWQTELAQLRQQLERTAAVSPLPPTTYPVDQIKHGPPKSEPVKPASPVLGTVMEQFDKLRQQRSTNRPPFPKTR